MINEKTILEEKREKEYEKFIGMHDFIITNILEYGSIEARFQTIEEVLHKLKLDLMFNCTEDRPDIIQIEIKRR